MQKKKCEICGKTFYTSNPKQKVCCASCRRRKAIVKASEWRKNNLDRVREISRKSARKRRSDPAYRRRECDLANARNRRLYAAGKADFENNIVSEMSIRYLRYLEYPRTWRKRHPEEARVKDAIHSSKRETKRAYDMLEANLFSAGFIQ